MKETDFLPQEYRELTCEESFGCNGGGFAYDVGRLLRFMVLCSPNGSGVLCAVNDFIETRYEL